MNFLKFNKAPSTNDKNTSSPKIELNNKNNVIIHYKENKYQFSLYSFFILLFGSIIFPIVIYYLYALQEFRWMEEIAIKQSVFLTNLLFNIDAKVIYASEYRSPWFIFLSSDYPRIHIVAECTAIWIYTIFAGIIFFTPHSRIKHDKRDIYKRKLKLLIISISIAYPLNLLRISIVTVFFYYNILPGSNISVVDTSYILIMTIIFIILTYNWLPEFFFAPYSIFLKILMKFVKKDDLKTQIRNNN